MLELAKATELLEAARRVVEEARNERRQSLERLRSILEADSVSPSQLQHAHAYRLWCEARLQSAEEQVRLAEEGVQEARRLLEHRTKERKILEQLRVRYEAAYRVESNRREQKLLDEVGARLTRKPERTHW